MPNTIVPATGEAMPAARLDGAAIMTAAWANYHRWHSVRESIHGPRVFDRREFAFKLQCAWADVKLAALTPVQRRAETIRTELDGLKFKSFAINTEPMRARLTAELSALAA